jgi:hypothetical protein
MIDMAQLLKVQYEKIGAVFADGELANNNKHSLFSTELLNAANQSNSNALANGILLEPIYHVWTQDTFTLDVCKLVTSKAAYDAAKTFNSPDALTAAEAAGWTYVGTLVIDVE